MHAVVLAGGPGSRFWPASRGHTPKPFVPMDRGETLFEATLERLAPLCEPERTWVVAARSLAGTVRAALRGHKGVRLLLEPEARNTAAAIAWAAARVHAVDREALIGVFPADHHIERPAGFRRCLTGAARCARRAEALVLVGVEPDTPDTAYGYLRVGRPDAGGSARVERFVEKPDPARARRYLRHGGYLWTAGLLVAPAGLVLEETHRHAPEVWRALGPVLERTARGGRVSGAALERAWRGVRPISFDHAVLERTDRVRAVRGRFGWSDVGSWHSVGPLLPRNAGNRVLGASEVVTLDSRDNIVWNETGQAIALVGMEGHVVVNTDDALLVCPRERAQDVRLVVDELRRRRRGDLL